MKNMKAAAQAQDTATTQEFVPTPLTRIVEIYSEQFKPNLVDEIKFVQSHTITREHTDTLINCHNNITLDYILNKRYVNEVTKNETLTKHVALQCAMNKQEFMNIIQELILEHGWRVAPVSKTWTTDKGFVVCLERSLSSFTEDDERIKASYEAYVKEAATKQREAYFALDKVQQFVSEFEQCEREQHMKQKADSIQSILSALK
ncbi:hypothetical protein P0J00_003457 [Vibrio vulnificus]|nr:hypothetical protein [Vibrio vulnificus]EKO5193459.1 hypothetical protein [Vibrio vulnificus]